MAKVSLLLEDAQHRAHRGSHRRIGQVLMNLGGRRVTVTVDEIHDLSLTATELLGGGRGRFRHAGYGLDKKISLDDNIFSRARIVKRFSPLPDISQTSDARRPG